MSRVLSIVERQVTEAERAGYLSALSSRSARASAVSAHFWVFEHATERGRFTEFTEAASERDLASAGGLESADVLWREVQGG